MLTGRSNSGDKRTVHYECKHCHSLIRLITEPFMSQYDLISRVMEMHTDDCMVVRNWRKFMG